MTLLFYYKEPLPIKALYTKIIAIVNRTIIKLTYKNTVNVESIHLHLTLPNVLILVYLRHKFTFLFSGTPCRDI